MKKRTLIIVIMILAAALAAAGITYYVMQSENASDESTGTTTSAEVVPWDVDIGETEETTPAEEIYLPGYASMTMVANTKEQSVSIGNPSGNHCYFVITLKMKTGWH